MSLRVVTLPGTGLTASALGFGCASLGSRIGRADGLRALAEAHDGGVTWFDVAPPYGAGEAEAILGEFLAGRRDGVRLCTKVGLAGPERSGLMRLAYRLGRPLAARFAGLRRRFRAAAATRYRPIALDAAGIAASLDQSLARLRTDHVDVFALHAPSPADTVRDDVVRALEDLLAAGKARAVCVAGDLNACRAGAGADLPYRVLQLADDPQTEPLAALREVATRPIATVTHSVFGFDGALSRLVARLESDPPARRRLQAAGYDAAPREAAASLLIDRAFASNPDGVVLASMFAAPHRRLNLARAALPPNPAAVQIARDLLRPAGA
ncbi:aldo/keto reductase [Prosthecodimorpha staleyi]|uniref:Aldo/keto reductase n=1 Tax=Prosthecodimorpha staleyi TaxID=2840188 RepID=A0A947DCH9_9HYPH|nr:aldo/keto reductase [Prosthecodimorpha staleyi]MBT9292229.1 aldo/keto reductase [Prosthecodimorpha staleyi]